MDTAGKIRNFFERLQALSEQKKKIILWSIVAVLAVVMGFFWVRGAINSFSKIGQSIGEVKMPQINTSDMPSLPNLDILQTADWKTYTNNDYGFEIKYPLILEFNNSEDGLRIANASHGASIYDISIYPNTQNLSSEDFFISQMNKSRGFMGFNNDEIVSVEDIILGEQNVKAKKIVWDENIITVLIPSGNFMIEIEGEPVNGDVSFPDIFSNMLSTFKFTPVK